MLVEKFNVVAEKYSHIADYLRIGTLRGLFALADEYPDENNFKITNSIIFGQFNPGNDFSRRFMSEISQSPKDHQDRCTSFYRIFDEARSFMDDESAIRKAFDHFDESYRKFVQQQPRQLKLVKS